LTARWNQVLHNRQGNNFQRFDINVGNGVIGSDQVQVIYGWSNDAINLTPAGLRAPIGQWTHIAVSVSHLSSTSFRISTFRNGSLVSEETRTGVTLADLEDDFYVGYHPGFTPTATRTFDGQIDQIKVWDSALDTTQVSQSMHSLGTTGVTGTPTLRARYDFNEDSASTTAFDRVGTRHLAKIGTNARVDVKQTTYPSNGKTVITFPRTYLPGVGGWTVPTGVTRAEQLIVGGGGGGGSRHAGGGGAGALLYEQLASISGTLKVQVGQGAGQSLSGQSSFLGTTELKGGGGGAGSGIVAQTGGSGGGVSSNVEPPALATGTGLFNRGARGTGTLDGTYAGGGGGGARSAGSAGGSSAAGAGGSGYVSNITGSPACYAAGGGGGSETNTAGSTGGAAAAGGSCTSGQVTATVTTTAGAGSRGSAAATSATPNSGSGGGGGGYHTTTTVSGAAGFGGSGIVVVSYAGQDLAWSKSSSEQNYASALTDAVPADGAWTVEMWIKPDAEMLATNDSWYGIFSQMNDGDTFTQRASLWMRNGKLHFTNGGTASGDLTGYTFSESRWYHLAMSSNTNTVKIFLDGTEVLSTTLAKAIIGPRFSIGGARQHYAGLMEFAGHIDQVKVWGGALTAAQLTQSMHTHSTTGITSPPTLRAHYDFNEFVTGQVLDRSGNNRHLAFNTAASGSYASTNFTDSAIVGVSTPSTRKVYQFNRTYLTALGGWMSPDGLPPKAQLLIIAGGGGGGGSTDSNHGGGGGGAGGYLEESSRDIQSAFIYPVTVGVGGLGGESGTGSTFGKAGNNGGDSIFGVVSTKGGGAGASWNQVATSGG
jgi:hypothetical protein